MDRDTVTRWVLNLSVLFSVIILFIVVMVTATRGSDASPTSVALAVILLVLLPFCTLAGIASMRGRGQPIASILVFGVSVIVFVCVAVLMIIDLSRSTCTAGSFVVCDGNDAVSFGTTVFFDAFVIAVLLIVMWSAHHQMLLQTSATVRVRSTLHFDETEGIQVEGEPV